MDRDPVIEEIRATRDQLAAKFGYDIDALARYAREKDAADKRKAIRVPTRRKKSRTSKSDAVNSTR